VAGPPVGFEYRGSIVSADEEKDLVGQFGGLPFKPSEFHGFLGKRRIVSFGWRYNYATHRLGETAPMPAFLVALRDRAAKAASFDPEDFRQALITEYSPRTAIGWHRDKAVFAEVLAVSLRSPCLLRFRKRIDEGWERHSVEVQPRSLYVLRGPARHVWEHSIPPVSTLRYSVTFRSLASPPGRAPQAR
jgi:alkylated DNA repair dioxygenase AlkB